MVEARLPSATTVLSASFVSLNIVSPQSAQEVFVIDVVIPMLVNTVCSRLAGG